MNILGISLTTFPGCLVYGGVASWSWFSWHHTHYMCMYMCIVCCQWKRVHTSTWLTLLLWYWCLGVPPLSGFMTLCRSLAFIPISVSLAYIFRGQSYMSIILSPSLSPSLPLPPLSSTYTTRNVCMYACTCKLVQRSITSTLKSSICCNCQ